MSSLHTDESPDWTRAPAGPARSAGWNALGNRLRVSRRRSGPHLHEVTLEAVVQEWTVTEAATLPLIGRRDEVTSDAIISFAIRALGDHPALLRLRRRAARGAAALTLREAAQVACVEPHYLSTVFRLRAGMTFVAWRRILRAAQAVKLIETRSCSIEDAVRLVGYHHRRSLERAIKKLFGTTPRSLRRRRGVTKPWSGKSHVPQNP